MSSSDFASQKNIFPDHIPVMGETVINSLKQHEKSAATFSESRRIRFIDATFGRGGYTRLIRAAFPDSDILIIDRDPDAIAIAKELKATTQDEHLWIYHGSFSEIIQACASVNWQTVTGICFDLGVSSPQLDQAERGFSFRHDGPLDMRMSQEGQSAADLIDTASEEELADIFYYFGEERAARKLAKAVVLARHDTPITTTFQLRDIIHSVIPPRGHKRLDPATKSFQALRIAVNNELGEIEDVLADAASLLAIGGVLAVVSFHSLEDRIIKHFFKAHDPSHLRPLGRLLPGEEEAIKAQQPKTVENVALAPLAKKPVLPTEVEIAQNGRARSAKLRASKRVEMSHA